MDKNFNWKPYYLVIGVISIIAGFYSWKIGVGLIIGSIAYFLRDRLNLKKFPSLDTTTKAVGSLFLVMFIQGLLILASAVACWFIGKLECFLACFVALIVPNIYFFVMSLKK